MRYELTDHKWAAIKPMLPKPRGVPRVNDRRVAYQRWPKAKITLRQGARVVEKNWL